MLHTEIWTSCDELAEHESQWDALWRASSVTFPGSRCRLLKLWLEEFASESRLRIITAWSGEQLVGALPLVETVKKQCVRVGCQPDNEWSAAGTLMLDCRSHSTSRLARAIATQFDQLPWPAVTLQAALPAQLGWRELADALTSHGWFAHVATVAEIGVLPVERFAQTIPTDVSSSRRRHLRHSWQALSELNHARIRVVTTTCAEEATSWAGRFFDLEEHARNVRGGTSVRSAGLESYFIKHVRQVAEDGHLMISFLELGGDPIAGQFGWLAKSRYHALKTAFEPELRSYGPGQLLMWQVGNQLADRANVETFDCLAPIESPILRGWHPLSYPLGRLWAARPTWFGRTLDWGQRVSHRNRHSTEAWHWENASLPRRDI